MIVKIDGLPGYYVDRFAKQRDPQTGKPLLPWFDEIFYKNGTRVPYFYTRGMSLSGPSWGQLDTGHHLQIKGNVEYDRYTFHAYDYLNFIPYYFGYGFGRKADMPAAEVMDQLKIPLFCDAFPYEKRYTSQQLYQRGNEWEVLENGARHLYPGNMSDFIDEWTIGLDFRRMTVDQTERDIVAWLTLHPEIDYFDYYDTSFDHVSHHNNDTASRLNALKQLDRLIGRLWVAIQSSPRADETALVLISDHGFNSEENVYSQGFNLVKMLASSAGGGHHVVTKRRLMLDYSIKGVYPFVPLIRTTSSESYYLKGQSGTYPTALVDFDGNERSSIHLRNSDLNVLHILLTQLQHGRLTPDVKAAATDELFSTIDRHRSDWQDMIGQLSEELDALHRWILPQQRQVAAEKKKYPPAEIALGIDKQARRIDTLTTIAVETEADYRKYIATVTNLLGLRRDTFNPKKLKIEGLIAENAMGESNSVYQLQNYTAGLSSTGLTLDANKRLDFDRSFKRIDYFDLLHSQIVRSNAQAQLASRPVDFVGLRLPVDSVSGVLNEDIRSIDDPIWLYGGPDKQALILTRADANGGLSYRYIPVAGLRQDEYGKVTFQVSEWADGFPLKYFEDKNLAIPSSERAAWLSRWHTEMEWLNATHKTVYSNAIIGLNEQLDRHPLGDGDGLSDDDKMIARLRGRQRRLTEADMLILANNHWNFDVRGFNPGGNHGSFFRVSTNSTFMIAGGAKTGIPRGFAVETPYDGMSFMPTILRLMGKIDERNQPVPELAQRGFRRFPGRVIGEITGPENTSPLSK